MFLSTMKEASTAEGDGKPGGRIKIKIMIKIQELAQRRGDGKSGARAEDGRRRLARSARRFGQGRFKNGRNVLPGAENR